MAEAIESVGEIIDQPAESREAAAAQVDVLGIVPESCDRVAVGQHNSGGLMEVT